MRFSEGHKLLAGLRWLFNEGKHAIERNLMMTTFVIGLSAVSFAISSSNTSGRKDTVRQGTAAGKAAEKELPRMRPPPLDS
ncbi:hypothetical protein AB4Z46_14450 [Variovorax sp. M-6]|uniref:hypothetical protein n=1 Tax=Variovorax sp. M-6 TaxID=3233041 RepID=UPI003F9BCDE9